jgi:thiamine-monophosphate kinase
LSKGLTMADEPSAEDRLIARYFAPLATHPGAFGLIDDAAAIAPPPGCDLVVTTDGIIEGVHFFPDDPPDTVSRKVLRMNLSDLAAKGAKPAGFLISVALPAKIDEAWLKAFAAGLGEDASHYNCPLLGGDTDRTPGPISVSISAFGVVPHGAMVRRSSAKVGDCIVVSGTIGDSALGVRLRKDEGLAKHWRLTEPLQMHLKRRYLLPQPRNVLAEMVLHHASAAMDVSDGLVGDIAKLCRASGVAADIDVARVPFSDAVQAAVAADPAAIEAALTGGDDYEILLTLSPDKLPEFGAEAKKAGVAVNEIGRVTAGQGTRFLRDGKPLAFTRPSYSHF